MNVFDKICALFAFVMGIILLVAGVFGFFAGVRVWFTLPPILGLLPALAGWGIVRPVYLVWNMNKPDAVSSPEL